MTLAQAQAVAAAATNAGFDASMSHTGTAWIVRVTSSSLSIPASDAAALAAAQGVTAKVALIEFS